VDDTKIAGKLLLKADIYGYRFSVEMSPLNVDRIQSWIDQGRLDISKPITIKELNESRCLHGIKDGVKLLARVCRFEPLILYTPR